MSRLLSHFDLFIDAQETLDLPTSGADSMYQSETHADATHYGFHDQSSVVGPSSLNMDLERVQLSRQNFGYGSNVYMQYPDAPVEPFPSVSVSSGYEAMDGGVTTVAPSSGGANLRYGTPAVQPSFGESKYAMIPHNSAQVFAPMVGTYTQSSGADARHTQEDRSFMYTTFSVNTSQS